MPLPSPTPLEEQDPARIRPLRIEASRVPFLHHSQLQVDLELLGLLSVNQARRMRALPLHLGNSTLSVAMADTGDLLGIDRIRQVLGGEIDLYAAAEEDILHALDQAAEVIPVPAEAHPRRLAEASMPYGTPGAGGLSHAASSAPEGTVISLVQEILLHAFDAGASDVHFEPAEKGLRVRIRLDGQLSLERTVSKALMPAVIARLKVLGELDVAESRRPQDGRSTLETDRRRIHLRISSLPTQHGESMVVRILPSDSRVPTLERLELDAILEKGIRQALRHPHGVLLVTGPTGSGKTTTLYALLNELNQPDTAVFTLEDPVEMPVPGVRQTQIHEEAGLTYAAALRALLRQDPDVILVGETRDSETAQLMVRAAMTGHQILTTLHTNDALGAIPRLIDMGVEPCLLPDCLNAILAQRLVRRLCPRCRRPDPDPVRTLLEAGVTLPTQVSPSLWQARGCLECRHTGYRHRRALLELCVPDEPLHDLILRRSSHADLMRWGRSVGMRTLWENGLQEALNGVTSLQEIQQAIQLP